MTNTQKNLACLAVLTVAVIVAKRGPLMAPQSPIPAPGLHVLILEETANRTPELAAVINGKWRESVPAGNLRMLDPFDDSGRRVDFSALEPKWRAGVETWSKTVDANGSPVLPWLIVSNAPHGGESKPLVAGELVSTIEKWAQFSPAPSP